MPLYEYRCLKCGSSFEILQRINEKPVKKCPKCGGPVQKVISPPALQFKGNGWYITDYAQKKKTEEKEKGKEKPKNQEKTSPKKKQSPDTE